MQAIAFHCMGNCSLSLQIPTTDYSKIESR